MTDNALLKILNDINETKTVKMKELDDEIAHMEAEIQAKQADLARLYEQKGQLEETLFAMNEEAKAQAAQYSQLPFQEISQPNEFVYPLKGNEGYLNK